MPQLILASVVGSSIVERFWDALVEMFSGRLTQQAPITAQFLQQMEKVYLGPTDDLTLNPAVQEVFHGMRVAGLILLAFCTVISLAEMAEAGITGTGGSLTGWFKRFFVATLMTFGGLQVYGLWIRLFNALLSVFRNYLDTHWTDSGSIGGLYERIISQIVVDQTLLVLLLALFTLIILVVLWFLIGGIRQAELILNIIIAPIVWPLYLIQSLEGIPKTALRGFLGLNAILLFAVAMIRMAVRMAIGTGETANFWNLVPAVAMLCLTIFLPATIKRIVGQGHTGVSALMTAVQMASGLKFLALGVGGGAGAAAAAPAAAGAAPSAPAGASAYPLAAVPSSGVSPSTGAGGQAQHVRVAAGPPLGPGRVSPAPMGLMEPIPNDELCIDLGESMPGTGRFDEVIAVKRFQQGVRQVKHIKDHQGEGDR